MEGEIDFGRNIPPSPYALNFILKAYKDEKNYSN